MVKCLPAHFRRYTFCKFLALLLLKFGKQRLKLGMEFQFPKISYYFCISNPRNNPSMDTTHTEAQLAEKPRHTISQLTERDISVFGNKVGSLRFPLQANAYVSILCLTGQAKMVLEGRVLTLSPQDLFMCRPDALIENGEMSVDFTFRGLILSPGFLESIFNISGHWWDAQRSLEQSPVLHLNEEETRIFLQNCDFLQDKLHLSGLPHRREMLRLLVQSLAYEFCDIIQSKVGIASYSYTASENLFSRFLALLDDHTPRHRDLGFYATRLHVTPKYLSAVCKEITGHTALSIITERTIGWIKRELRTTDSSIKEIAMRAGFSNLSFFGKYLKRETGFSPKEYRMYGVEEL